MGAVVRPEDVVLKMFDALKKGDYEEAAEYLDPATEQQLDFWGWDCFNGSWIIYWPIHFVGTVSIRSCRRYRS